MFLKTLQWRLVLFFCIVAICLIIPIGFILNKSVEDLYYKNFVVSIDQFTELLRQETGDRIPDEEMWKKIIDKNDVFFYMMTGDNKSYTIFNKITNELYHSTDAGFFPESTESFYNQLLASENFIKALKGDIGKKKKLNTGRGRQFFDFAEPIGDYIIYFRYYKEAWQNDIRDYNNIIWRSLIVALMVAFLLGYLLSKTITRPILRIMYKAESIAKGDFEESLDVKSDDEIGKLTGAFNHMAENLKNTLTEISSEKNKIETVLNYMTDGVIAFNLKGEVIHNNPASRRMLGEEHMDATFDEYAERYGLNVKMEDILYLEDISSKELNITWDDRVIRIYFAVFTDENKKPEGLIAVLQDITEQEKLEKMRKDFVANVSHEMRTPITSIKSYTETLLDGALEDRETTEQFLSIINAEADRMTNLVKDLLQLSRIDSQQMQWSFERISFLQLVKSTVEKLDIEARQKKQTLECYAIGEIPEITADYGRIEQVVQNIVNNAIKYTQENGKISVYIGKTANEVYVKVADNGIGIPEQDLPRIFERFYRVDKARSREMGGTGLGLSIAKDIVEAHSGTITIASQLGKGTEVTIRLPIGEQPMAAGL